MKYFALFALSACTLLACQSNEAPSFKETQVAVIKGLEAQTLKAEVLDTAVARKITHAYILYVDSFPADSAAPYYLSKAADVQRARRETALRAINLYNRVLKNYPDHPLAARSVFMIGFTFDEVFGDKNRAVKSYTYFLEQYPTHDLADDAQALLMLAQDSTMTDLDLINKWEQENKQQEKK
jgi:hypothetical protein